MPCTNKAVEILNRLFINKRAEELQQSNTQIIKTLQEQGLYLVLKDYKISLTGFKTPQHPDEITEYDYSKHPTIAAMTGKMFGIIAIDVDKPEKVPSTIIKLIEKTNTLKAAASSSNRFKAFFKVSTTRLKDAEYLHTAGLEILYKRPPTLQALMITAEIMKSRASFRNCQKSLKICSYRSKNLK
jgi:hypothetical protein